MRMIYTTLLAVFLICAPSIAKADGYTTLSGLYSDCALANDRQPDTGRKHERCENFLHFAFIKSLKEYKAANMMVCGGANMIDTRQSIPTEWSLNRTSSFEGYSLDNAIRNEFVRYWDYKGVGLINGYSTSAQGSVGLFFAERREQFCKAVTFLENRRAR